MHFNVRLSDERLCTLHPRHAKQVRSLGLASVLIGARADGQKELIAVEDGDRENAESLKTVLRDLKWRGMQTLVLAVGDAAPLGRRCGRCVACDARTTRWMPRDAQVIDKLPCEALTMLADHNS